MEIIIFNSLLFVSVLLVYWYKRRKIDCGFFLILIWTLVSICGIFLYESKPEIWNLQLWPFIYLFVVFLLFARPYLKQLHIDQRIKIQNNKILDYSVYLYIICSVVAISMDLMDAKSVIASGEYSLAYQEKNDLQLYTNIYQRFAKIYCNYFRIVALIALFNYICLRKKMILVFLLALSIFTPLFLASLVMGTRGGLLGEALVFASIFTLYRRHIPAKAKKTIYIIGASIGWIVFTYAMLITESRFEYSSEGASGSLVSYFGQAMLQFNYGLSDSINNYLYGVRTFKYTLETFGLINYETIYNNLHMILGTHFDSGFTTFIGMLCCDFGHFGTLILGLFFPMVIIRCFNSNNQLSFAEIYIYIFYLNRLIMGVFTNSSGIDIIWIMAFLIYFILKKIFK